MDLVVALILCAVAYGLGFKTGYKEGRLKP